MAQAAPLAGLHCPMVAVPRPPVTGYYYPHITLLTGARVCPGRPWGSMWGRRDPRYKFMGIIAPLMGLVVSAL
jgi:hypothetical protein